MEEKGFVAKAQGKNTNKMVWRLLSCGLVILLLVINVLSLTVFENLFNIVLPGGRKAIYADGIEAVYQSDYESKEDTLKAANAFNEDLNREGIVLLKNKNNAIPIATPVSNSKVDAKPKISVFGKNSVNIAYGGSGSGGASTNEAIDLYSSLEVAGFEVNPKLRNFYNDSKLSGNGRSSNSSDLDSGSTVVLSTGETPQEKYTTQVKESYQSYNDAAIVVFTRIGGEGFDLPRTMKGATGARMQDDHFLRLDQNELDLLDNVCTSGFEKVIVLINAGNTMELGFLESTEYYPYANKIDAALNIGFPGNSGLTAVGEVLNGMVNPSGRTVDTYSMDFKKDPTWNNFGDNRVTESNKTLGGDQYSLNGKSQLYYFVDYEEGVYVGYKYYETRGKTDGEDWYRQNVVYPFGYGLSYTEFSWEVVEKTIENTSIEKDQTYTIKVNVTNIGSVAGKEVVQLYAQAPYFVGGIEKSHKTLMDFTKTAMLEPGESEAVELTFDPYYLASYDYKDQNRNGNTGYELDKGDYMLYVSENAHVAQEMIAFSVSSDILYTNDPVTDAAVVNRYTDCEDGNFNSNTQLSTVLSRSDWTSTWPTTPNQERYVEETFIDALKDVSPNNPNDYSEEEMPFFDEEGSLTLRDMILDENGDYIAADYNDTRWETLISQCSISDLINMYNNGAFKSMEISTIEKPLTNDTDGPAGFVNFMDKKTYYGACYYCSESVIGATWNLELVEKFGEMVGNEGIWGDAYGKGNGLPYSGWYAPGVNIHRSQFGGRNFEYYSEDGILNGKMAAAQIRGCQKKGVYCFMKHFALNEQETHRSINGDLTWVTEQAMREIFLRPFEIAVKDGEAKAVMSSFNRIGTRWTGGDYRLITEILRQEWGFQGMVICDFNTIPQYMNSRQMAYAGGDLNLATFPESWCDESDVADVIVLRNAVKNVLYTVANSNAMNGKIIGYQRPLWQILMFVVDGIIAAGIIVSGIFVHKSKKTNNDVNL